MIYIKETYKFVNNSVTEGESKKNNYKNITKL